MKKQMMLFILFLAVFPFFGKCNAENMIVMRSDSQVVDVDERMKQGRDLYLKAFYEEAEKEFLFIVSTEDAPFEDKIKARTYLIKIYRAYGEDEKVKMQAGEILKLNPNYTPSSREPASIKKIFNDLKEEIKILNAQASPETLNNSMIIQAAVAKAIVQSESLSFKLINTESELKKLKASFYISSLALFALLAFSIALR